MNRVTISLPEKMNAYVQSQVATGQYGNTSEYIRELIRKDQSSRQMAITELQSILNEAEQSETRPYSMDEIKHRAWKKALENNTI